VHDWAVHDWAVHDWAVHDWAVHDWAVHDWAVGDWAELGCVVGGQMDSYRPITDDQRKNRQNRSGEAEGVHSCSDSKEEAYRDVPTSTVTDGSRVRAA
jgi:hypothetical protein